MHCIQVDRYLHRWLYGQTNRLTYRRIGGHADSQAGQPSDQSNDQPTDRQTDRWTNKQTVS